MTSPADADDTNNGPRAVPDNYDDYLVDEYGYAYGARDIVPLRTLEAHDRFADDPETALEGRDREELDDFERLGLARGYARAGDFESFATCIDRLLESSEDHDGVRYLEIPLYGATVALHHDACDRAEDWLELGIDRWPEAARPARLLLARVAWERGNRDRTTEIHDGLADAHPTDPEVAFEIAEDLASLGADDRARDWIDAARERARRAGDRSIEVDLDVLESRVTDA